MFKKLSVAGFLALAMALGPALAQSDAAFTSEAYSELAERAEAEGRSVSGYGAAAKGNRFLNTCGVGPDRIVNTTGAFDRHGGNLIVVDFGTATTFDYLSKRGEYQGGAIAPGLSISAEALYEKASKLPRVEITCPPVVIAKNTVNSMQSGLFYGYVGLVDGIALQALFDPEGWPPERQLRALDAGLLTASVTR